MFNTIVLGAGMCGLASGMMLARDGHRVTVLERDPAPVPDSPEAAWERWGRRGIAQFRQAHFLQARVREVLDAELPDVQQALAAAGALRLDPVARMPTSLSERDARPGDERLVTWTARRPTLEHAFARAAEAQEGMEVRRGVSVSGLETRRVDGRLHVTGVRDERGERLAADLVVDAMGRRSALPKLLCEAGGDPVHEEAEDCGFLYYTRFFRSADGSLPEPRGPYLAHVGSFSIATLPADAGTWSITLFVSSRDQPLKRLRDVSAWSALVRACPQHAHWLEGTPITGIMPMGGVIDRYRRYSGNGAGPVSGVASVADAWACTNPSLGRGIALGLSHVALLRRVVREHADSPADLARAWDEATERELTPWYRATVALDRARLAEIDTIRTGAKQRSIAQDDITARVRAAMPLAMSRDPDVFRAGLEISSCLALPQDVLARPGLAQRVLELAGDGTAPPPGPTREQVLQLMR
jgi:2-polyprenyl-6-methoxyphenol hydroxylase-like FAD-dependent oxidoreductase